MQKNNKHARLQALTLILLFAPIADLLFSSDSVAGNREDGDAVSPRLNESQARILLENPKFRIPRGWKWGFFKNADSAKIRYGYADTSLQARRGTVVLVPGFTEFAEVYFETLNEFLKNGYDVYVMDWRGAGGSSRYSQDREKATSLGFEHDESDLEQFIDAVVKRKTKGPVYLVAHSLGSHIALRYLHDHPKDVAGAALSAPPFNCPGTQAPPWVVNLYSWIMVCNGRANNYVDKQGDWNYMAPRISKLSTHSHSADRVRLEEAWCAIDPSLRSGGATWRWLQLFQQSCDLVNSPGYASAIKTPTLIGCALCDRIASPEQEEKFAAQMPDARLYKGAEARHDLFLEDDQHRTPWMNDLFKFFDSLTTRASGAK